MLKSCFTECPSRYAKMLAMSQMVIDGRIQHKIDLIGNIYINHYQYFTVYRRYNSPYDIIIEDFNGDIHQHKDYTIRDSLKLILCLSDDDAKKMYSSYLYSFKHNAPMSSSADIPSMRWSAIHNSYQAVNLNIAGILPSWIYNQFNNSTEGEEIISSTPAQIHKELIEPLGTSYVPLRICPCFDSDSDDVFPQSDADKIAASLWTPPTIERAAKKRVRDEIDCCDDSEYKEKRTYNYKKCNTVSKN